MSTIIKSKWHDSTRESVTVSPSKAAKEATAKERTAGMPRKDRQRTDLLRGKYSF